MKKVKTKKGIKANETRKAVSAVKKTKKPETTKKPAQAKDGVVQDKSESIGALFENVERIAELDEFISWIALPSVIRQPATQQEFAKEKKVSDDILTKWKKRTGFYEEVMRRRRMYFRDDSADILLSLKRTCLRDGKGADAKVFLNYTGDLQDKTEHVVDEELQKVLKKIGSLLPD
jgi:hypothetical protein